MTHASGLEPDDAYARFSVERRQEVLARVSDACRRAGRDPSEVTVEAVSKTVDVPEVIAAWRGGYRVFGENRPQELARKLDAIEGVDEMAGVRFDMIGNLQKNKINQVIGRVQLIHSVSSEHLAQGISSRSVARGIRPQVLLEVNVSGEQSKSGFSPSHAHESFERLLALEGIDIKGLMTMAPRHDPDAARATFSGLRDVRDGLSSAFGSSLPILSCGMSDDFEIAIEEGSTLVRLGRVVFDQGYMLV